MDPRRALRVLSKIAPPAAWAVLLVGALAVAGPVATGDLDPEWLRVARMPVVDVSGKSLLQVPEVPARFTAQGPLGTDGTWSLTGEQVIARDPRRDHDLLAPRLTVRRAGAVVGELRAARGRIRIPRDKTDPAVRLDFEGGVELVHGDVAASTSAASVWLHRRNRFDPASGGVRLTTPGPVALRVGAQRLTAAGCDAMLVPLTVELRGPIALDGVADPSGARSGVGAALLARPLRGRAARARLQGALAPGQSPRDLATAFPSQLELTLEQVTLEAVAPDEDTLACARLRATFVRNPASARAALGGLGGAPPGPELQAGGASYALDEVTAEGQVRARHGVGARGVTIEADVVSARASTGRAVARGRPARLSAGDGWLEAPELTLVRSGDVRAGGGQPIARVEARGARSGSDVGSGVGSGVEGDVRFAFTPPPLRAGGPPEAPRPWLGHARSAVARVRLSPRGEAAVTAEGAPGPLERLERLDVEGPLTLAREDGSSRVEARRLTWDASGRRTRIELEGEPVVATLGADLTGEVPWRARARSVRAWLEPAAFASRADEAEDEGDAERPRSGAAQAVASAVLEGDVELARQGDDGPRRHVALRGQRLVWSRHRERAELTGPAAAVTVGEGTLRGSALTFDVARGRLQAAGPCVLEVPFAGGGGGEPPATLSIEAARAEASVDPRPVAWREAGEARRGARRAGARLVVPGWLRTLTLEGDGARRVRASGPDGLSAEGDRLTWDSARGWLRLEAAPGATVRAATKGVALDAAQLDVRPHRSPGRSRALVIARGGVRLRGSLPTTGGEPVTLTSDWLSAEVWEPVRQRGVPAEEALAPFGRVLAGGPDGLAITGDLVDTSAGATGPIPLRVRAARLEADGTRETLRLDGWPDRPLVLARGDVQLEASTARLALEDRRAALRLALDGPWTCTLPPVDGTAGRVACAGPLELVLDVARARAAGEADTRDPTALAGLLRAFDARGGLEVTTRDVRARADRATLGRPGELVLHGDPVEVTRGGMRSRGREQVLRIEELSGR